MRILSCDLTQVTIPHPGNIWRLVSWLDVPMLAFTMAGVVIIWESERSV